MKEKIKEYKNWINSNIKELEAKLPEEMECLENLLDRGGQELEIVQQEKLISSIKQNIFTSNMDLNKFEELFDN